MEQSNYLIIDMPSQIRTNCSVCNSNSLTVSNTEETTTNQFDAIKVILKNNDRLRNESEQVKSELLRSLHCVDHDDKLSIRLHKITNEIDSLSRLNNKGRLNELRQLQDDATRSLHATVVKKQELEEKLASKRFLLEDLQTRLLELSNLLYIERMKNALQIFKMIPVLVFLPPSASKTQLGTENSAKPPLSDTSRSGVPQSKSKLVGCSSILSIPLPNNGLYNDVPCDCVALALFHVAQLVDALSAALHIPLPHPLMPFTASECLISPQYDLTTCFSLSPVLHISDRRSHEHFSWLTVSSLLRADLSEGKHIVNPTFSEAITLLQANVVALCMQTGIPPECLWPPQAMLLNLHELFVLCLKCVKRNSAVVASTVSVNNDRGDGGESGGHRMSREDLPEVYSNDRNTVLATLTQRHSDRGANALAATASLIDLNDSPERAGVLSGEEEVETKYLHLAVFDAVEAASSERDPAPAERDRAQYDSLMSGDDDDYDVIDLSAFRR